MDVVGRSVSLNDGPLVLLLLLLLLPQASICHRLLSALVALLACTQHHDLYGCLQELCDSILGWNLCR